MHLAATSMSTPTPTPTAALAAAKENPPTRPLTPEIPLETNAMSHTTAAMGTIHQRTLVSPLAIPADQTPFVGPPVMRVGLVGPG